MDSVLLVGGVERDYMDLTDEERKLVREAIDPAFKTDYYAEDKFKWLFKLFKIYYQRDYSGYEEQQKFRVFADNLRLMNDINAENKSFSVRINKFADKKEIAMPPGLMKALHEKGKKKYGSRFTTNAGFKLDRQIQGQLKAGRRKNVSSAEDVNEPSLIKGPEAGLDKFAVKTENLTDPDQKHLGESN